MGNCVNSILILHTGNIIGAQSDFCSEGKVNRSHTQHKKYPSRMWEATEIFIQQILPPEKKTSLFMNTFFAWIYLQWTRVNNIISREDQIQ